MWPLLPCYGIPYDAMIKGRLEIVKLTKLYIALSAYTGSVLAISGILNLAWLKYVKITRKNSSIRHAQDWSLTKTIAIIFAIVVVTYSTLIIFLNIAAYSLISPKNRKYIQKIVNNFLWVLILCQSNAILNSVVYLVRNSRMRRYCYKLFRAKKRREVKKMQTNCFQCNKRFYQNSHSHKSRNALSWHIANIKLFPSMKYLLLSWYRNSKCFNFLSAPERPEMWYLAKI